MFRKRGVVLVNMRMTRSLLVVALLLLLPPAARTQDPATPAAAASQAQQGDVLWYGKAPPGWGGVVTDMKLIAPNVGWAERGGRLYWTKDNGATWKDITPPIQDIGPIFFLDIRRGWATVGNRAFPSSDEPQFDVASTANAGATWSVTHATLSLKDYEISHDAVSYDQGSRIVFADPLHGWMNVQAGGQTMNGWFNFLLVTSDGGRTWHPAPDALVLEEADILLVTPNDGWMVGGEDVPNDKLYATSDGAKSWREVSLGAPKEILPVDQPAYDLPVFEDSKHGFVAVTYTGGSGVKSAAVLFATVDGGRTWTADRILKNLAEPGMVGDKPQSTMGGSTWITAVAPDGNLILSNLDPGVRVSADTSAGADRWDRGRPRKLSFVSPTQGWLLKLNGELLSTMDGGVTWTTLTPGPQPHVIQPHGSFVPRPAS